MVTVEEASEHLKDDLASLLHQLAARVEAPTSSALFCLLPARQPCATPDSLPAQTYQGVAVILVQFHPIVGGVFGAVLRHLSR